MQDDTGRPHGEPLGLSYLYILASRYMFPFSKRCSEAFVCINVYESHEAVKCIGICNEAPEPKLSASGEDARARDRARSQALAGHRRGCRAAFRARRGFGTLWAESSFQETSRFVSLVDAGSPLSALLHAVADASRCQPIQDFVEVSDSSPAV